MFTKKSENPNYCARIIRLGEPRKHSNADRLLCHSIMFNNVITDLSYKKDDLVVYFPLECAINKDFVSYFNGFAKKELNQNQEVRGFFDNNSRVRAVKLRGEPSAGFIIKLEVLLSWLSTQDFLVNFPNEKEIPVDEDFDSYKDILICSKYVVPVRNSGQNIAKQKVARESSIVEGQFHFHPDTKHLKKELHVLKPDDLITISYKLHGTSAVFANILTKKKLSLAARVLKKIGFEIQDTKHDLVASSRRVIKSEHVDKNHDNFYDSNIWVLVAESLKEKIPPGYSLYGEIVGFLPSGAQIQSKYDYGCRPNTWEFFVYRVTFTDSGGQVIEFTTPQVQRFCQKFDLKTVPVFYYGRADQWLFENSNYSIMNESHHWHKNFLTMLISKYTEKNCYLCKNIVPEEGIVLQIEGEVFNAFKLKSWAFLEAETKLLDSGEQNIEDSESAASESLETVSENP